MVKRIIEVLVVAMTILIVLTGCSESEESLNSNIAELKAEIVELELERDALNEEIVDIKVKNGTAKYVVTFNIQQSHFSFDLSEHLKDEYNAISIQIPVDKEYYDSVEIGDTIDDSFRMGSLVFKGSFGNWDITVEGKEIQ